MEIISKNEFGYDLYLDNMYTLSKEKINHKLGFVTLYARKNIREDIAELCSLAETSPSKFHKWLSKDSKFRNPKIIAKVKLAQENNLLPKGFIEYSNISKLYSELMRKEENINKKNKFLNETKKFLKKNPNSVYEGSLRSSRGYILRRRDESKKSINEYEKALMAKFKNFNSYHFALLELKDIYSELGNKKLKKIYQKAQDKHFNKFKRGQLNLSRVGVNDFLKFKGELKD